MDKTDYKEIAKRLWNTDNPIETFNPNPKDVREYDSEKVFFCKTCLSLKIKNINEPIIVEGHKTECFCENCLSTDIGETYIMDWDRQYTNRYKKSILITNKNNKQWKEKKKQIKENKN